MPAVPEQIARLPKPVQTMVRRQCGGDWARVTIDASGGITVHNQPHPAGVGAAPAKRPAKRASTPRKPARPKPPAPPCPFCSQPLDAAHDQVVHDDVIEAWLAAIAGPATPPPTAPTKPEPQRTPAPSPTRRDPDEPLEDYVRRLLADVLTADQADAVTLIIRGTEDPPATATEEPAPPTAAPTGQAPEPPQDPPAPDAQPPLTRIELPPAEPRNFRYRQPVAPKLLAERARLAAVPEPDPAPPMPAPAVSRPPVPFPDPDPEPEEQEAAPEGAGHEADRDGPPETSDDRGRTWTLLPGVQAASGWDGAALRGSAHQVFTATRTGLPAEAPLYFHGNVLALNDVDLGDVEAVCRYPSRVAIAPESVTKGYPVLVYRRGDVRVVVGFREPEAPKVLAAYFSTNAYNEYVSRERTGGGGSRKQGGLPSTGGQLVARLRELGAICDETPDGRLHAITYAGQDLGKVETHADVPRLDIQNRYQAMRRKIEAIQRRAANSETG